MGKKKEVAEKNVQPEYKRKFEELFAQITKKEQDANFENIIESLKKKKLKKIRQQRRRRMRQVIQRNTPRKVKKARQKVSLPTLKTKL